MRTFWSGPRKKLVETQVQVGFEGILLALEFLKMTTPQLAQVRLKNRAWLLRALPSVWLNGVHSLKLFLAHIVKTLCKHCELGK